MTTSGNFKTDKILILDFGSQYTQLIARRIRECGVYSEVYSYDASAEAIYNFAPRGIILSGGPASLAAENNANHDSLKIAAIAFQLGVPILGICYGMQALAAQCGGEVARAAKQEFGRANLFNIKECRLFDGVFNDENKIVWMSHGDQVIALPDDFVTIASSDNAAIAAIANESKKYYGVQFHPEVTHTAAGKAIFSNFVSAICGCRREWTMDNFITSSIAAIKRQVGDDNVVLGLSGGVDSSVVAALLQRAIGAQLRCVFVDTGLLRLNEGDEVMDVFATQMGIAVQRVDAAPRFYNALQGVSDPEQKRKIIGKLFVELFDEQAEKIKDVKWLAQGTIYPDVIESAGSVSGKAQVIKSHHNVGGLPENMNLQLLEPLRQLFKDEVRQLGLQLNLPRQILYRHPFPGPGLGVRIIGEVKREYADLLRQADAIFIAMLHQYQLYEQTAQAFAVFLPIKSVGVVGDGRRYDYVIALRAVESSDFMTARWAQLPYQFLDELSRRIINEVPGISRVVYDISGKPPATIEWE